MLITLDIHLAEYRPLNAALTSNSQNFYHQELIIYRAKSENDDVAQIFFEMLEEKIKLQKKDGAKR